MSRKFRDYYPPLDLIEEKLERESWEISCKLGKTFTNPEREELWRQLDVLDRKRAFHRVYGKKLWYSHQPNVNYTIEDIEQRLSEIDTDSIPEMDYRLLASKRSSTLRTLMQKLKNFLTRPMRLPKG
jgi:ATP-dependent DNA ligase